MSSEQSNPATDRRPADVTPGAPADGAAPLGPLQGGRWRPVRPDELLRKSVPPPPLELNEQDETPADQPRVPLQRRQELEHRLKEHPTDLDAFMELGRIYRAENRPGDARRIFKQATEIFPNDKGLLWEYEEAVLARSVQQLREVSELAQRLATVETDRELRRSQDDWACRRMDVCRARLARDASLTHLRLVLAEAMHDAGMYEGAIDELDEILDNDELSPPAYLLRGRCLLATGNDIEAMASLRAASLRRSVVAPLKIRVAALRLLCETAARLDVALTLQQYRQHLQLAEQELARLAEQTG